MSHKLFLVPVLITALASLVAFIVSIGVYHLTDPILKKIRAAGKWCLTFNVFAIFVETDAASPAMTTVTRVDVLRELNMHASGCIVSLISLVFIQLAFQAKREALARTTHQATADFMEINPFNTAWKMLRSFAKHLRLFART